MQNVVSSIQQQPANGLLLEDKVQMLEQYMQSVQEPPTLLPEVVNQIELEIHRKKFESMLENKCLEK